MDCIIIILLTSTAIPEDCASSLAYKTSIFKRLIPHRLLNYHNGHNPHPDLLRQEERTPRMFHVSQI
jgi:hypothetical protein